MYVRTVARSASYGFAEDADVRAVEVESAGLAGMRFTLVAAGERRRVTIPTLGRLAVHNALAAAAVGIAAGLDLDTIAEGLARGWSAPHRGQLRPGGVTIVDDSYNASPGSVIAALDLLGGLPGRRVAVLGEMLELGDAHVAGHLEVGEAAAGVADLLVVVGDEALAIADGARDAGLDPAKVLLARDRETALDILRPRLREGDVVLVKASRGSPWTSSSTTCGPSSAEPGPDDRAHPGPAPRVRVHGHPDGAVHPPPARAGFGKQVHPEGPETHYVKEGTPTMGGILLIAVVVAIYLFLRPLDAATFAPLATLVLVGGLGAFDDYMNARTGEGIRARQKLIWLTVVAVVAAWQIQQTYAITAIAVPFVGAVPIDPTLYIAFAAFAIVAMANGVNLTDGLDGLAGGPSPSRSSRTCSSRCSTSPAGEPRAALRAHHRRAARVPVVQRPPGPDLHGRRGRSLGRRWRSRRSSPARS